MRKFDLKQFAICVLAVISPRLVLAGAYPLVPVVFMSGFLSGVSQSLLFLCSIGGLLALAPFRVTLKYGMVILLSAAAVRIAERYTGRCRTAAAAIVTGAVTTGATVVWKLLQIPDDASMAGGIAEGVAVAGAVFLCTRFFWLFQEWEPYAPKAMPVYVRGAEKLTGYAESFNRLSRTFQKMNRYKSDFTAEELGRMQNEVAGSLCVACERRAVCWEAEDTPMYRILYQFLQSVQRGEDVGTSAGELSEHCVCVEEMVGQAMRVFEKARLNLSWYNRLQENRDAIAQQLTAMAYIMEDCAADEQDVTAAEGTLLARIRFALKERGIVCDELRILKKSGGKMEIWLRGHTRARRCVTVRDVAKDISRVSDSLFLPEKDAKTLIGEKGARVVFLESTRLSAGYGVAKAVREGEQVSGDNFSFRILDDDRCIMGLSDGMGSGYSACKESEMVIDLIEKFMESGFRPDTALRMMNSAMVTHGENNLFSTVDLVSVDMDSGAAQLYKIGAAATFIRHEDWVEQIEDHSMPVGVFMAQTPSCREAGLAAGDFVVMVTDGVLEHLCVDNAGETVAQIIQDVETNNPAQFARQVLEQVLSITGGRVRDAMTVLAAEFWENRSGC
ncbi:MAG: SpoIIE family protein phosphatase [Lachnospiraceae bacterium]|nr:SpoIIE family protein phosphatase [Lachnospiraceae bacterium]